MDFDVVIATRNRPDALALSLPLLIGQSRPPAQIIIIDSSDDTEAVDAAVDRVVRDTGYPIRLERGPRGSSHQRNRGIALATAPVIFFPDDDSLCYPGTTAALMEIYERDAERRIAGICATDALVPPPGVDLGQSYAMDATHAGQARRMGMRHRMEKALTDLNPFLALGQALMRQQPAPEWIAEYDAVPVEWMTGYRMSFRAEVIRETGFEETFAGYGLYEDIDASFSALRCGALVGAHRAAIYHHRFPNGRPDRFAFAAMSIVNRGHVIAKQTAEGRLPVAETRAIRRKAQNYARLRMLSLLPRLRSAPAREDFRGSRAGLAMLDRLFAARPEDLPAVYAGVMRDLGL